jgi:hypothetical protein
MACANNRVWVFGSETSEAYEDTGDADNPFQPIKGSLFQIGCAGTWTMSVGVSTIRWVGRSGIGGAVVYRLDGYAGTRISTHAIEAKLAAATTLADAEAVTIDQDGHLCYALTCPSAGVAGETWVFDETERAWHQRSAWNADARPRRDVGRARACLRRPAACRREPHHGRDPGAGSGHLRRRRRDPARGAPGAVPRRGERLRDPRSRRARDGSRRRPRQRPGHRSAGGAARLGDSGKTWWSAGPAAIGAMGEHGACVFWTRLGQVRIDRLVLEVVITDPVKRIFGPGLWLSVTPGRAAA